jgi:hypothetical protein
MSARSFGSLFMVASCAGAALGCYLVSLRVASERAALEDVETRIVLTQRDLRLLQTEIGTRGRLSQLERWNAGAFELSAPAANQFLEGSFQLAKLTQPERQPDFHAPVVLASAPAPAPQKPQLGQAQADDPAAPAAVTPGALLHQASLKTETREVPAKAVALPQRTAVTSKDRPATAAKPAPVKSADEPGLAAAKFAPVKASAARAASMKVAKVRVAAAEQKKSVDKPALGARKPVTKRVQLAKTDPLAPLSDRHSVKTKGTSTGR